MPSQLRFDGRVAVVTGAGGGLGRAYAIYLASQGAKIVVNDLGGSFRGEGSSTKAADVVVNEIRQNGGQAVANYDSVTDGDKIIKTAIDTWERIDILVNNAGILRDVSFSKMKSQDWDLIYDVHLKGSYKATRAAWPYMIDNKYGRIIMVTSAAGLYGNFGQSNYSSMKMALVGLANTLAIEGAKFNIHVNTISPIAGSRMTETIMPPEIVKALRPEFVTPLVAYLVHESTQETGGIFEVGAGWISRVRWQRTRGVFFDPTSMTADAVSESWNEVNDWTNATNPKSIAETFATVTGGLQSRGKSSPTRMSETVNSTVDVNKVLNYEFPPSKIVITPRDVMLYALAIGDSPDPSQLDALRFTYENHPKFQPLPVMGVIYPSLMMSHIGSIPGLRFDPMMLLHGEQYLVINAPLPTSGELTNTARIKRMEDKGKGALLVIEAETRDAKSQLICTNEITLFIRGIGGFGGSGQSQQVTEPIPNRSPDRVERLETGLLQALLYRLASGDMNPLHVDPDMSGIGGFKRPILHGLCTMGYSCRAVIKHYANNEGGRIKSIKVRFSKHVFPGETLAVEMWQVSPTRIVFQTRVMASNEVVLSNGVVEMWSLEESEKRGETMQMEVKGDNDMQSAKIFGDIAMKLSQDGLSLVKSMNSIYRFNVVDQRGKVHTWTVDMMNGSGSVYKGQPKQGTAHVTLEAKDEDLFAIMTGKANAQEAFMRNKLKINGNISLATKLDTLVQKPSKL